MSGSIDSSTSGEGSLNRDEALGACAESTSGFATSCSRIYSISSALTAASAHASKIPGISFASKVLGPSVSSSISTILHATDGPVAHSAPLAHAAFRLEEVRSAISELKRTQDTIDQVKSQGADETSSLIDELEEKATALKWKIGKSLGHTACIALSITPVASTAIGMVALAAAPKIIDGYHTRAVSLYQDYQSTSIPANKVLKSINQLGESISHPSKDRDQAIIAVQDQLDVLYTTLYGVGKSEYQSDKIRLEIDIKKIRNSRLSTPKKNKNISKLRERFESKFTSHQIGISYYLPTKIGILKKLGETSEERFQSSRSEGALRSEASQGAREAIDAEGRAKLTEEEQMILDGSSIDEFDQIKKAIEELETYHTSLNDPHELSDDKLGHIFDRLESIKLNHIDTNQERIKEQSASRKASKYLRTTTLEKIAGHGQFLQETGLHYIAP